MTWQHSGNIQPHLDLEEHDGENNAKRVNVVAGGVGLATVAIGSSATIFAVVNTAAAAQASVALDSSIANIGFATVRIGTNVNTNIGLVTVAGGQVGLVGNNTIVLGSGVGAIGFATVAIGANVNTNIGLVTVSGGQVGLVGNTTVLTRNAGTNKVLTTLPVLLSTASIVTVITPTTSNAIYITHLLLNSNSTVRLNIKSGVTYLTGNVSLGPNIFPGGGWVQDGTPDSPVYAGNASGPLVVEKFDSGGLIAQVAGMVTFYQE